MKTGEEITHNWHADGGGIIKRTEKGYELYEVPMYGGDETFVKTFETLDEAKEKADRLT
jgi:hypothetical protein